MELYRNSMIAYIGLVIVFIGLTLQSVATYSAILPINILAVIYFSYRANVMRKIIKENRK